MRKLYILGMILAMCATFSACNDEWKEELYTQMISFKAPLGDNSLNEIYVRYQPDGMGIYQLPVIVSGSKNNDRNIDVKIAVDEDTLRILNQEKFPVGRQDLWYVPLAKQHYSLNQIFATFLQEKTYSSIPSISTLTGWNWMRNMYFR